MGLLSKVLTNLSAGAARSLNDKYATQAAVANAKAKGKQGGGSNCSPCQARAQIHAAQQQLGLKGWYKAPGK